MKFLEIAALIASTTAIGFLFSERARTRTEICKELLQLCDLLRLDMGFRNTLLTELIKSFSFKYLDFLTMETIANQSVISSPLTDEENREISAFLYSLGKSNAQSQILLIDGFREYVKFMITKYSDAYTKNSKLFITFGFFSGALISLAVI